MANTKVSLVRKCKTPEGWKRYPVVLSANGRLKAHSVEVNGVEVIYPVGHYELRHYEGRKLVWTRVKGEAADALIALNVARKKAAAVAAAEDAGVQVIANPSRLSLREARDRFVEAAQSRGAEEAAEVYCRAMDEFFESCTKQYVDELDHSDVIAFHRHMRGKGRSDRTAFNRHMNLRSFLIFVGITGAELKKIAGKKPRLVKTLVDIYEPEELAAFFKKAVKTDYDGLLFDLLLHTGLREREASHLEWKDIKADRRILKVESKPRYKHKIKDAEERELPLSAELLAKLTKYRQKHPSATLVFGRNGGAEDKPDGHLLRRLKTLARNADLNCGTCDGCTASDRKSVKYRVGDKVVIRSVKRQKECEKWYLHKFRANYITTLLRNGMDLRTVMTLSGHEDLESVERYIRPADKKEVHAKVNSIRFR
jgi:integrase